MSWTSNQVRTIASYNLNLLNCTLTNNVPATKPKLRVNIGPSCLLNVIVELKSVCVCAVHLSSGHGPSSRTLKGYSWSVDPVTDEDDDIESLLAPQAK